MRKPDLAAAIAEKADLTKEQANRVLNAVLEEITQALHRKDSVTLVGTTGEGAALGAPARTAMLGALVGAGIDPAKQITAARSGYIPLSTNVTLPDEVVQEIGMTPEQVRARNWSPNWYTIAADIEARMRLADQILDRAR